MELLKEIAGALGLVAFGIFGIYWQVSEWREDAPRLIYWIGIIPLPIGLVGVISLIAGVFILGKMIHLF